MSSSLLLLVAGAAVGGARAQCPGGGMSMHDRCWYLGEAGATCAATCQGKGLGFLQHVAGEAAPMVPKLLGREPGTRQFAWARLECYVPGSDRYHTAKPKADGNAMDRGDVGDWSEAICRLACPCTQTAPAPAPPPKPYPDCPMRDVVFRHDGAHAIFVDLSAFGSAGCWQNDCKHTDKFNADHHGICARVCAQIDECTHWSFGEQEDVNKCFFRKSDAGGEASEGFMSAPKACAPPALPDAFVALSTATLLLPCDEGKSDKCPDMAAAIATSRFAIRHLKTAVEGKVDPNTINFINQISDDTDSFAAQISEDNFPVVMANARQVFKALHSWMDSQPKAAIDPSDASLPNPLRGHLCGASSCFEKVA